MRRGLSAWIALLLALTMVVATAQKWKLVTNLATDLSRDETILAVDSGKGIVVDRDILLETRDGKIKERCRVKHVYGTSVILYQGVRHDFPAGSPVYQ
jgi:hypothetical protein